MLWYLLQSRPHQEDLAVRDLIYLGVQAFSPYFSQSIVGQGNMRSFTELVFPGYLFAKFNAVTEYQKVACVPSVQKVVTLGLTPAVVDENIIEMIHSKVKDGHLVVQTFPSEWR